MNLFIHSGITNQNIGSVITYTPHPFAGFILKTSMGGYDAAEGLRFWDSTFICMFIK